MSEGKSLRGKVIAATAIGLALVLGVLVLFAIDRRPRTHDARIFAYSAAMASEISGRIVQILVTNDQDVAKGAPLLVIDPVPYELQLRQARAQVAALKAQIALTGRQVTSQGSGVQAAESQVQRARDQLRYAQDTRKRLEPLVKPGFVTQQQLDEAKTNEAAAEASAPSAHAKRHPGPPSGGRHLESRSSIGRRGSGGSQCRAQLRFDDPACPVCGKGGRIANCGRHLCRRRPSALQSHQVRCLVCHRRLSRNRIAANRRRRSSDGVDHVREQHAPLRGAWKAWARACSRPIKTGPVFPSSAATSTGWWSRSDFPSGFGSIARPPLPCTWD